MSLLCNSITLMLKFLPHTGPEIKLEFYAKTHLHLYNDVHAGQAHWSSSSNRSV